MFESMSDGFFLKFENGYSISVRWGPFHYRDSDDEGNVIAAEVAVFDPKEKFIRLGEFDDVLGHQTPNQVAELIAKYSSI